MNPIAFSDPARIPLRFAGKDAADVLQSKLTADVRPWRRTGGQRAMALDIQGRLVLDAHWRRTPQGDFLAFLTHHPPDSAAARDHFDRYIIREACTITLLDTLQAWFILGDAPQLPALLDLPIPTEGPPVALQPDTPLERARGLAPWDAWGLQGWILWAPREQAAAIDDTLRRAGVTPVDQATWDDHLLLAGQARPGIELLSGETIPLESGAWDAFVFGKGCYLGQEVIERVAARGRLAWKLARLVGDGAPPPPGTPIGATADDGQGQSPGGRRREALTGAVPRADGGWSGLAWLRRATLDAAPDTLTLATPEGARDARPAGLAGTDPTPGMGEPGSPAEP
jgi:folate-binding protein YgfZ